EPGRSCGALPWTTTVSLKLPRSNSPIRKEERLDQKLRTDCSLRLGLAVSEGKLLAIGPHTAMAPTNKSLAQMNKPSDVDKATKKYSALRDASRAERAEFYFDPFCQLAPAVNGWGFFPSMAAMNKCLAQ